MSSAFVKKTVRLEQHLIDQIENNMKAKGLESFSESLRNILETGPEVKVEPVVNANSVDMSDMEDKINNYKKRVKQKDIQIEGLKDIVHRLQGQDTKVSIRGMNQTVAEWISGLHVLVTKGARYEWEQ